MVLTCASKTSRSSYLALSQYRDKCGLRSASFKKAPHGPGRYAGHDAAFDELFGHLPGCPVTDGTLRILRLFAGHGHDLANLLRGEGGWPAAALFVAERFDDQLLQLLIVTVFFRSEHGWFDLLPA